MREVTYQRAINTYGIIPFGFLYLIYHYPRSLYAITSLITLPMVLYAETSAFLHFWANPRSTLGDVLFKLFRSLSTSSTVPAICALAAVKIGSQIEGVWPEVSRRFRTGRLLGLYRLLLNRKLLSFFFTNIYLYLVTTPYSYTYTPGQEPISIEKLRTAPFEESVPAVMGGTFLFIAYFLHAYPIMYVLCLLFSPLASALQKHAFACRTHAFTKTYIDSLEKDHLLCPILQDYPEDSDAVLIQWSPRLQIYSRKELSKWIASSTAPKDEEGRIADPFNVGQVSLRDFVPAPPLILKKLAEYRALAEAESNSITPAPRA